MNLTIASTISHSGSQTQELQQFMQDLHISALIHTALTNKVGKHVWNSLIHISTLKHDQTDPEMSVAD